MEFADAVGAYLAPDAAVRTAAVAKLDAAREQNPKEFVRQLLHVPAKGDARGLVAVLLRQTAQKHPEVCREDQENCAQGPKAAEVQSALLQALNVEVDVGAKTKWADTIATFAGNYLTEGIMWPTLFEGIPAWAQGDEATRVVAFTLLERLVNMDAAFKALAQHSDVLMSLLRAGLGDPTESVRRLAVKAFVTTAARHEAALRPSVHALLPLFTPAALQLGVEGLQGIAEIAEADKKAWQDCSELLSTVGGLAMQADAEEDDRLAALEAVVTLVTKGGIKWAKKNAAVVQAGIKVVVALSREADEDVQEWAGRQDDKDCEEALLSAAMEAVPRLLQLEGKVRSWLLEACGQQLASSDWQAANGALLLVTQLVNHDDEFPSAQVAQVHSTALGMLGAAHPRVRWAALELVTALCTQAGPKYQRQNHSTVLVKVVQVLQQDQCERVKCRALSALAAFFEELEEAGDAADWVTPYLADLMQVLVPILQAPDVFVQELGLGVISTVAQGTGQRFAPFYGTFMPMVKSLLTRGDASPQIRCAAIELCGNLVGTVPVEQLGGDVVAILEGMFALQQGAGAQDYTREVLSAWGKIAKALGAQFAPFLQHLLPSVLERAGQEAGVIQVANDCDAPNDKHKHQLVLNLGDSDTHTFEVHTTAITEKYEAVEMIGTLAEACQTHFAPHAQQTCQVLQGLFMYKFFHLVRKSAFTSAGKLIRTVPTKADRMVLLQTMIGQAVLPLTAYKLDQAVDYVLPGLQDMLEAVFDGEGPAPASTQEVVGGVLDHLAALMVQVKERIDDAKKQAPDDDDDEDEDEEGDAYDGVMECVGVLTKALGEGIVPHLQAVVQLFAERLLHGAEKHKVAALAVFADLTAYAGASGGAYAANVLPVALELVVQDTPGATAEENPDDEDRVQVAAYAIGTVALRTPAVFGPHAEVAVQKLEAVLAHPHARSEDRKTTTENAASALVKCYMLLQRPVTPLLPFFPLEEDEVEARTVHPLLMQATAGQDSEDLRRIRTFLAQHPTLA